jgi:hypothetical protein
MRFFIIGWYIIVVVVAGHFCSANTYICSKPAKERSSPYVPNDRSNRSSSGNGSI